MFQAVLGLWFDLSNFIPPNPDGHKTACVY